MRGRVVCNNCGWSIDSPDSQKQAEHWAYSSGWIVERSRWNCPTCKHKEQ